MNGPELIFHIGHHKTGSTAIQHALATGSLRVEGRRILYTAALNHNGLRRHVEHFATAGEILPGSAAVPNLETEAKRLAEGGFDTAIFSAEEFEGADPKALKAAMERFFLPHVTDHRIVCYLRPHAGRILSNFAEDVKLGHFQGTLEAYHQTMAKSGRLDYVKRLAPWQTVFGSRFLLRAMVRDRLHGQSVLEDFARTVFGPEARLQIEDDSTNETLCLEDLAFVRQVQSHLQHRAKPLRHAMGWTLALAAAKARRGTQTRLQLDRALAERIRRHYLADAQTLDRTVLAADPVMVRELEKAVDTACAKPQSLAASDHFSPDELRHIEMLAGVIDVMLENDKGHWPGFLRGRRIAALHGAEPAPKPAAKEPRAKADLEGLWWEVLNRGLIDRLIALRTDNPDHLHRISKRLNNIFIHKPEIPIRLSAGDMVEMLEAAEMSPGMRDVLCDFLVQLAFHHNAKRLAGDQKQVSLEDLARRQDGLGRVIRYVRAHDARHGGPQLGQLQGGILYMQGALVAAYAQFDEARRALIEKGVKRHHNGGLLSLRPLATYSDWARSGAGPFLPPMRFASDRGFTDALPIVVVGLDGTYYARYAQRLADTAQGRANLHFHVINPDPTAILHAPHLRYSFEDVPHAPTAYFATVRFLRLPELLAHYKQVLVTSDADALFCEAVTPLVDSLKGQDMLLNMATNPDSPRGYLAAVPWRRVTAQTLVAAPTAGTAEFLAIYGRLYAGLTEGGTAPEWWVDQALLSATADLVLHERRKVRLEKRWLLGMNGMVQRKA